MREPIRLRQIVVATEALEPVIDLAGEVFGLKVCYGKADLSRYGIPYTPPPPHQAAFFESHGLKSAQIPIGDTFLELLAPTRAGTATARYLERRGPGGYMVLNEVASLAPFAARMEKAGIRTSGTVDYDAYNELQTDPRDVGASMLSFAVQREGEPFDGGWYPGGPLWRERAAPGFGAIVAAELAVSDPAAVAQRWASVIGREARRQGDAQVIDLDASAIRFVPAPDGQKDRLDAIYVAADGFDTAAKKAKAAGVLRSGDIILSGLKFRDAGALTT